MTTPTTADVGYGTREPTVAKIDGFRGRLISADDADYNIARAVWNGAIDRRPRLIARCIGTADVVAAVRFARDHDLEIAIRGGEPPPWGNPEKLLTLPLSKLDDEVLGHDIPFFNDWWTKETPSAFGRGFMNDLSKIKIPVLHISGWWDGDGIGTKLNWAKLREAKHQYQWLIYGPWES